VRHRSGVCRAPSIGPSVSILPVWPRGSIPDLHKDCLTPRRGDRQDSTGRRNRGVGFRSDLPEFGNRHALVDRRNHSLDSVIRSARTISCAAWSALPTAEEGHQKGSLPSRADSAPAFRVPAGRSAIPGTQEALAARGRRSMWRERCQYVPLLCACLRGFLRYDAGLRLSCVSPCPCLHGVFAGRIRSSRCAGRLQSSVCVAGPDCPTKLLGLPRAWMISRVSRVRPDHWFGPSRPCQAMRFCVRRRPIWWDKLRYGRRVEVQLFGGGRRGVFPFCGRGDAKT